MGLRYRKNDKTLPGKPDIIFIKAKTAIFCDGDFWYGQNWVKLKSQLRKRNNATYWISKISYNIQRDKIIEQQLKQLGWRVFRFWESDIKHSVKKIASNIKEML